MIIFINIFSEFNYIKYVRNVYKLSLFDIYFFETEVQLFLRSALTDELNK